MKPKILYITDLYYEAKGRDYSSEDLMLTEKLSDEFDIALCNPRQTEQFESCANLIVFRNAGPVANYKEAYNSFLKRIKDNNLNTYNNFTGKGDMAGKDYLLQMTRENLPVIQTVDSLENLELLPQGDKYLIKPKDGADSIGLEIVNEKELKEKNLNNYLIQPFIDFEYEVSFYFIDSNFQYALYAPDKSKRWELKQYDPTNEDIDFANKIINWNTIDHGIQRVDACRTRDGKLLLVELEDLNPYLSLDLLDEETRENFIRNFKKALHKTL